VALLGRCLFREGQDRRTHLEQDRERYNRTVDTSIAHGSPYGLGLIYGKTMFGASEGH